VPGSEITIPGHVVRHGEELRADRNAVSPDYFKTMNIAVVQGRDFLDSDSESSPRVAIINEAMAKRFWPGINPVGQNFKRDGDGQHPIEIVGVVKNSRTEDVYSPIGPAFYVPILQDYTSAQTLQVRTFGQPQAIAAEISSLARKLAPTAPVLSIRTMSDAVRNGPNGLLFFNLGAKLTATLGFLGLTLAVVGIYGVIAYDVRQRTQEIGIRIALGARGFDVLYIIVGKGMLLALCGILLGVAGSLAVTRVMTGLLYEIKATDPLTFLAVALLLGATAFAACCIPALRAMRISPVEAFRDVQ